MSVGSRDCHDLLFDLRFRDYKGFPVLIIESGGDVAGDFDVLPLIFANRNKVGIDAPAILAVADLSRYGASKPSLQERKAGCDRRLQLDAPALFMSNRAKRGQHDDGQAID